MASPLEAAADCVARAAAAGVPGDDGDGDDDVRKVLIVDRSLEFDEETVAAFAALVARRGASVSVRHADDFKGMHSRSSSILAIMKKTREVVVVHADTSSKPSALPKDLRAAANRIIVLYVHTKLKKLPFAKKQFDRSFVVNDEDGENQYIGMARGLLNESAALGRLNESAALGRFNPHDLNMVSLVLLHNVLSLGGLTPALLRRLYEALAGAELLGSIEAGDEAATMALHLQASALVRAYAEAGGPAAAAPKRMEFTQHLSKYSVQCATRKKLAAKADFLASCERGYEDALLGPDCPEELAGIRQLFDATLRKMFEAK